MGTVGAVTHDCTVSVPIFALLLRTSRGRVRAHLPSVTKLKFGLAPALVRALPTHGGGKSTRPVCKAFLEFILARSKHCEVSKTIDNCHLSQ